MSSNLRITRICQQCGESFIAKTTVTKNCSNRCARRAYKARKRAEKMKASKKEVTEIIERPIVEVQARDYLSVDDTCRLLNVSRSTIWRLAKTGVLKTAKLGSRVIIRKSDLNKLFS